MPNITSIEVEAKVKLDNGETVTVTIHDNGSGSSWGASREAIAETVDLREAIGQVVYEEYASRNGDGYDDDGNEGVTDEGDDDLEGDGTLYPVVEVGQVVVLTGSAWADRGGLNVPALVVDIDTSDEKVGPVPVARWVSGIHGDHERGTLDPDADESWAYRLATPEEVLRFTVRK